MSQVIDDAGLRDHGILLEYQLPMSSSRLDCMITGQDEGRRDNAVILELKQWETCGDAGADNLVTTFVGGRQRDLLHLPAQVHQYQRYLQDSHTTFYEPPAPIELASCAYLHNYIAGEGDVLFADRFRPILNTSPVFTADDVEPLQAFLLERLREGRGEPVLRRVEQSTYRPSKKLLEHVGQVVKGNPADCRPRGARSTPNPFVDLTQGAARVCSSSRQMRLHRLQLPVPPPEQLFVRATVGVVR